MKKGTFKDKILYEFENNQEQLITMEELREKAQTIFIKTRITLPSILIIKFNRIFEIEDDVQISKLIRILNLNDWINKGRNYISV
ncbi:hypothetical protein [Myroides sp. LJL110]